MEKMLLPYVRYFEFGGRSTRTEYWLFSLFIWAIGLIILIGSGGFDSILFGTPEESLDLESLGLGMAVLAVFALLSFIPALAVTVRRFHDVGLSGWLVLGIMIAGIFPILDILSTIVLLVITVLPSDGNDNQWGENPHGHGLDHRYGLREDYNSGKGVRYR